jgi:protocatechuate 3,4-dioxygenase beta subunit
MRARFGLLTSSDPDIPAAGLTRRGFLGSAVLATATLVVAACSGPAAGSAPASTATGNAAPAPSPSTPTTASAAPASAATAPAPTSTAVSPTASAAPATSVLTAAAAPTGAPASASPTAVLTPTDSNVDAEDATPSETEGPYFKANSPERASLIVAGVTGTKLTISGRVLSTRGQPIAKALLDFWQANAQGSYDNAGYTLRGHQFSDAEGHYLLVTVIPGLYPGRTRHIHVKVQAPSQPVLTTQLYFPNEPRNNGDSLYNPKLLLTLQDAPDGGKVATFNFVLNVG